MGLVARVLETAGIPTVTLSMIPDLTRAVGVPRLAGIGYPMGRPMGMPHDADGQREVLRALLELLDTAHEPGTYVELPFAWPQSRTVAINAARHVDPPIVGLLKSKPWLLANLYTGRIPQEA